VRPEIARHYAFGLEAGRLFRPGDGELERLRTQDVIARHLPATRCVVLDIGGAAGVHALWLAGLGHDVHLVDAMPLHVVQARAASAEAEHPLASVAPGDACQLTFGDATADVVLLLGPLYHLVDRVDRMRALSEVRRVLKPGGIAIVAAISRFASTLVRTNLGRLGDERFAPIAARGLRYGTHSNPDGRPEWFTTAWFHRPEDLAPEIEAAGLRDMALFAVEGPAWMSPTLADDLADPPRRTALLAILRELEREPSLLGASAHLLAIARRA
jgi:SAM-dependent methyltransferase